MLHDRACSLDASPPICMYFENGEFASLPMQPMSAAGQNDLSATSSTHGTPLSSPEHLNKRRKTGCATSRGVANLTPEQLAKKRANDREAQRAIRERTKAQIETLEKRIEELTSQQPYQELQAVIRQKDAIQTENEDIRRRLESVLSVIQPIVTAHGLTGKHVFGSWPASILIASSSRSCFSRPDRWSKSSSLCATIGIASGSVQR